MKAFIKTSIAWTGSFIGVLFTFIPESFFLKIKIVSCITDDVNIFLNRILVCIFSFVVISIIVGLYFMFRKGVEIEGDNYIINVEYGDIFATENCKKVIAFDECFTTTIGESPELVKKNSVCGQYLEINPINDIQTLIDASNLIPDTKKSKYRGKDKYESGRLIKNEEYLLLAFAKLNEIGRGELTQKEFITALFILWEEIDKNYQGASDICITILGSGITRMGDESLSQQKLLDIIIASYKLSSYKIKLPYKLRIICKKKPGFSINKIGKTL